MPSPEVLVDTIWPHILTRIESGGYSPHDPVTLSATLNANLLDIVGQELRLDNQAQNAVFAGPAIGGSGKPAFRSLVVADIPSGIDHDTLSNVTAEQHQDEVALSPTLDANLLSISGQVLGLDPQDALKVFASPTGALGKPSFRSLVVADLPAGYDHNDLSNITAEQHQDEVTLSASLEANLLGISGQQLTLDSQSGNTVFASPSPGGAGAPSFRKMVAADLCSHAIISKHSYSGGNPLDVVGLSAASTLAMLSPSVNPGATASLLKTDSNGRLQLQGLGVQTAPTSTEPLTVLTSTTNHFRVDSASDGLLDIYCCSGGCNAAIIKVPQRASYDTILELYTDCDSGQNSEIWLIAEYDGGASLTPADLKVIRSSSYRYISIGGGLKASSVAGAYPSTGEIWAENNIFVNETSNGDLTQGISINQGANDDHILDFKSSDVNHYMTTVCETDTFGFVIKQSGGYGGLQLNGLTEDKVGFNIRSYHTSDVTSKLSSSNASIQLQVRKRSGSGYGDPGSNANLVCIRANASTVFIFDAEGSAHAEIEWTTFDDYDDLALLRTLNDTLSARPDPTGAFGAWIEQHLGPLQELGVVGGVRVVNDRMRAMVNWTMLSVLMVNALCQAGPRLERLEQRLQTIEVSRGGTI